MAALSSYYACVCNIPPDFHSKDLRHFFSSFVETGQFTCFHFRHRPEKELIVLTQSSSPTSNSLSEKVPYKYLFEKALCCLVTFPSEQVKTDAIKKYHLKHWERAEQTLPERCIMVAIQISEQKCEMSSLTISSNKRLQIKMSLSQLGAFVEFKPPGLMPGGNVGTKTKHFLNLINTCQLPSNLIGKLNLSFPKSRSRNRYGNVPFDYGTTNNSVLQSEEQLAYDSYCGKPTKTDKHSDPEELEGEEEESEEEWDRHEALHDDVSN